MLNQQTQDFLTELAADDPEIADDYANHDFYCGYHINYFCTNPFGKCDLKQGEESA